MCERRILTGFLSLARRARHGSVAENHRLTYAGSWFPSIPPGGLRFPRASPFRPCGGRWFLRGFRLANSVLGADCREGADLALRALGNANLASVLNQAVAQVDPFLARDHFHQLALDDLRVFALGHA